MIEPPIYFVSGLPRSGSTLLMNLLGQNPAHHVTPTNDLLDMLVLLRDRWPFVPEFQKQGLDSIRPRLLSGMKEMMSGFYRQEIAAGKIIFDKSRGWLAYIELMEQVLQRPINILVTIRDVRAIVASFEKLYLKNPITDPKHPKFAKSQTVDDRVFQTLSDPGVVGLAVERLRDALHRDHRSHIMMIPYNQLCLRPQRVMQAIHETLGLAHFDYDPNNVRQITVEDDAVYGLEQLHSIRSRVSPADETPWKGVLPEEICQRISYQFEDIQRWSSHGTNVTPT